MTAALIAISIGKQVPDRFSVLLPGYWRAIQNMNPLPDQIVISYREPDTCGVTSPPDDLRDRVTCVPLSDGTLADYLNAAVEATETDWVMWTGLDDRPLPSAFLNLPSPHECDLIAGGIIISTGGAILSNFRALPTHDGNTVMSNTLHTREIWQRAGGYPDVYFNDWGFWLRCAALNPRIYEPKAFQMWYENSDNQGRLSGQDNRDKFDHAVREIVDLKRELGFLP